MSSRISTWSLEVHLPETAGNQRMQCKKGDNGGVEISPGLLNVSELTQCHRVAVELSQQSCQTENENSTSWAKEAAEPWCVCSQPANSSVFHLSHGIKKMMRNDISTKGRRPRKLTVIATILVARQSARRMLQDLVAGQAMQAFG